MLDLSRRRRASRTASWCSAASAPPSSRPSIGTPLARLLRARRSAPRRAPIAPLLRTRSSPTGRRRSRTSPSCACSRRKGSAPTCRRSASSASRRRPGVPGERLVVHGNNKSDEELRAAADAGAALVVLDSLEEVERAAAAGVGACSSASRSGDRGRHARVDSHRAARLEVRPPAGPTRWQRSRRRSRRGSTCGPPRARRLAAARARPRVDDRRLARAFAASAAPSSAGRRRSSTSAAGSASRHARGRACAAGRDVRRLARRAARARVPAARAAAPRLVLEPGRSLVGRAGVTLYRVGVVKRGERDGHARRGRRRHVGQPAAAALRRAVHGAARQPGGRARRPGSTPSPAALRGGGDRAPRAPSRPPRAATCSRFRRPARTRSRSARTTTSSRARPRCSSRRRGAGHPAARDARRPARARALSTLPEMAASHDVWIWSDYI